MVDAEIQSTNESRKSNPAFLRFPVRRAAKCRRAKRKLNLRWSYAKRRGILEDLLPHFNNDRAAALVTLREVAPMLCDYLE